MPFSFSFFLGGRVHFPPRSLALGTQGRDCRERTRRRYSIDIDIDAGAGTNSLDGDYCTLLWEHTEYNRWFYSIYSSASAVTPCLPINSPVSIDSPASNAEGSGACSNTSPTNHRFGSNVRRTGCTSTLAPITAVNIVHQLTRLFSVRSRPPHGHGSLVTFCGQLKARVSFSLKA